MIRIGILGATGYTALELIKILLRHPEAEIAAVTSRQEGEPHVASVHPSLTGRLDLRLEDLSPEQVAAEGDCVFSCLPHGASAEAVMPLVDAGVRVVDFSADYRLNDPDVYAPVVRRNALRRRAAGASSLRAAGAVRRPDRRRTAGGQSRLLSDVGHPGPGAAVEDAD